MPQENAVMNANQGKNEPCSESFDFDELEGKLQSQLDDEMAELQFLVDEKAKIANPDNLGKVIEDVVWEQFLNQIAVTAGEDFIKENKGLTLDLSDEAHIQTTENFAHGVIATHNTEINYKERYDNWQSNFQKDEAGNIVTHTTRAGKEEANLVRGARNPFDENRPSGSIKNKTDMDHTVSAAEIIRDPAANAHMTREEQIEFANSPANLNEMPSNWNRSKSDKSMSDWLDNPNANGQKPNEIFAALTPEEEAKLREKDSEARKEYEKRKKDGEQKSVESGKKSQREEAFRLGGAALRAAIMQLLAALVREIIAKLVKWFKSGKMALNTLWESLKEAIHSFIDKIKTHLINAGQTVFTTIATAIWGPIVGTIKKVWILLKQAWSSLKEAINYLKAPANKGKSQDIMLMEVAKIVIAGLTGAGAIILGELIEKSLMAIPIFMVEIPLIGSLANIFGIFFGAVVAGIIGAIGINLIEKAATNRMKRDNVREQIEKGNAILSLQHKVQIINEAKTEHIKDTAAQNIQERHKEAADKIRNSVKNIMDNNCVIQENAKGDKGNSEALDDLSAELKLLLGEK